MVRTTNTPSTATPHLTILPKTPGPLNAFKPHSPNNTASVALANTLRNDLSTLFSGSFTLYPTGSITASGSKYKSFRLESLYYACKLYTGQPLVATAQACTLSAVGFDKAGKTINEVTFSYSPNNVIQADMIKKEFGMDLDGVYGVNITIIDAGLLPILAVVNIDSLEICGYE